MFQLCKWLCLLSSSCRFAWAEHRGGFRCLWKISLLSTRVFIYSLFLLKVLHMSIGVSCSCYHGVEIVPRAYILYVTTSFWFMQHTAFTHTHVLSSVVHTVYMLYTCMHHHYTQRMLPRMYKCGTPWQQLHQQRNHEISRATYACSYRCIRM